MFPNEVVFGGERFFISDCFVNSHKCVLGLNVNLPDRVYTMQEWPNQGMKDYGEKEKMKVRAIQPYVIKGSTTLV